MKCRGVCAAIIVSWIIGSSTALAASAEQPGRDAFRAGTQAFQQGDYPAALAHFRAARDSGLDSTSVRYNMAVTYYRLGQLDASAIEFRGLLSDPGSAPTAHYNLGLIARHQGDNRTAQHHFRQAQELAATQELRNLATAGLRSVTPAPPKRRGQAVISVAGGYDDNVTLAPQADLVGVSGEGDGFLEFLAAGRYMIAGDASKGWRAEGALYLREYLDVDGFDQAALRAGLTQLGSAGSWRTAFGGYTDVILLDGDYFQSIFSASAQGIRPVGGNGELLLRYRISRIEADDDFDQLSGWRQRGRVQGRWRHGFGDLVLGYELEWNDRRDVQTATTFSSRSPLRNLLYGEVLRQVGSNWEVSARGEYRRSRYRDPDTTLTSSRKRQDDSLELRLRADRRLGASSRVYGTYTRSDNDSNFEVFDYRRSEFMAGLEWVF